ncbi:HNH endonuclease [Dyella mobilis]|uniref:HNH endonuclease n=1 Tax=Dyella mobilis TaxID=1849582 RepID=A0ABS2KEB9_9GAMM|nr:HNH endonuclease [Dyella mobilis]MBM7129449.1 HNH endonuclease [Dyella mobilis]
MRYWWVNHKQTIRQEVEGGYLWSPKRAADGARNQFYENMRRASPGDMVLSFAKGVINYIGLIQDFASPAPKPDSFGSVGDYWNNDGWLLSVHWEPIGLSIRPKDQIQKLGPLLPIKYSPIQSGTGNGNQRTYLAEVDKSVFELLIDGARLRNITRESESFAAGAPLAGIDDALQRAIQNDPSLDATTKKQLISARYGQGQFRRRIFQFERACRLTLVDNPLLLVASHIKPWRLCGDSIERLDGANGLLLTPHVDRLFDRGLISFEDNGKVVISPRLDRTDLVRLGLSLACDKSGMPFHPKQMAYLSFHRQNVLLP